MMPWLLFPLLLASPPTGNSGRNLRLAAALAERVPSDAAALLASTLATCDPAGAAGIARLPALVKAGETRHAAVLANALSQRYEPEVARAVLRLPAALLAEREIQAAEAQARAGDLAGAQIRLAGAAAADLETVEASGFEEALAEVRLRSLRTKALAAEAAHRPVVAFAYWQALHTLSASDAEAASRVAALAPQAIAAGAVAVAFRNVDARYLPDLDSRLGDYLVKAGLGPHFRFSAGAATWTVEAGVTPPRLRVQVQREERTKEVVAFRARQANEEWPAAVQDVQGAEERMRDAENQARELQAQAEAQRQQAASMSGGWGAAAVAVASIGDLGAGAILSSARNDLAEARRKLASTPQFVVRPVMADAHYFALVIRVFADQQWGYRLDGPAGAGSTRRFVVSAEKQAERVLPAPAIGVTGTAVDIPALKASATPDLAGGLAALGSRVLAALQAAEDQRLWSAAEAVAARHDVGAAVAYAQYLAAGLDARKKRLASAYLVRWLQ